MHDAGRADPRTRGSRGSIGPQRRARLWVVLVAAAAITWLFTIICLIGLAADGQSDARLGFAVLGVPFLVAALASTYAARTITARELTGVDQIRHAAAGGPVAAAATPADGLDLENLPGPASSVLQAMHRKYAELDAKLTDAERDTEAWRTMTQIVSSIVPTTVSTYRRVAGLDDADAEFLRAVHLLDQTFDERRTLVTGAMLEGLHEETRYIQDRFTPSELTIDGPQPPGSD